MQTKLSPDIFELVREKDKYIMLRNYLVNVMKGKVLVRALGHLAKSKPNWGLRSAGNNSRFPFCSLRLQSGKASVPPYKVGRKTARFTAKNI
jgi:hypothetical protein